ncbi:MAG: amidohydrolase [Bacillota bacterium]|nr:amidohydrolase [Bacillota bacterium]
MQVCDLIKKHEEYIVAMRRDFHRHPELSFQEVRTSQVVCDELDKMGIPYVRLEKNCVVGLIKGDQAGENGKKLAIRADMDALPITEEAEVPFKSQNDGVMHACGHDGHTAMLLGAGKMLKDLQNELKGDVYLCFQSAEEVGGGAMIIVDYLKSLGGVDQAIAIHLWADLDSGFISVEEGARMANVDQFMIEVLGRGGHGSRPDLSIDPIKPLCQIVTAISSIPANYIEPTEPCVVHVGRIEGGAMYNVFPDKAKVWGGIRTFSEKNRRRVSELIRTISENIAKSCGATARAEFQRGIPLVNNSGDSVAMAKNVLLETELFQMDKFYPVCASEDFGFFVEQFGGFMAFIGIRNEKKGLIYTQHHPKFGIDEDVLAKGSAFFAAYTRAFLN